MCVTPFNMNALVPIMLKLMLSFFLSKLNSEKNYLKKLTSIMFKCNIVTCSKMKHIIVKVFLMLTTPLKK